MDDFDYVPGFIPAPSKSTAAPKIDEYDVPQKSTKTVKKAEPVSLNRNLSVKDMIKVVAVTVLIFGMLSAVTFINGKIVNNNRTISELQAEVNQVKAENVRLNASLNAMVSADKVQEYAVSVLGMQKAERYQIHYFDDRDGDRVVIADGKALNADAQN